MPSHLTVNLLPTWLLEKMGGGRGKPGPRAAAWAGSTLSCALGSWTPAGLTQLAPSTHHTASRNFSPSLAREQIICSRWWCLRSNTHTPLSAATALLSSHPTDLACVERPQVRRWWWPALLTNLCFLELFGEWICWTNFSWLENKMRKEEELWCLMWPGFERKALLRAVLLCLPEETLPSSADWSPNHGSRSIWVFLMHALVVFQIPDPSSSTSE